MAFTAKIDNILPSPDGSGGIQYSVAVTFADSATGFTASKPYNFPLTTTQAEAVAAITADGQLLKAQLAGIGTLANKIGAVITI